MDVAVLRRAENLAGDCIPKVAVIPVSYTHLHHLYGTEGVVPLHSPLFIGNEKKYLNECIDTTFVSSVGKFVDRFEEEVATYTGAKKAVAVSYTHLDVYKRQTVESLMLCVCLKKRKWVVSFPCNIRSA